MTLGIYVKSKSVKDSEPHAHEKSNKTCLPKILRLTFRPAVITTYGQQKPDVQEKLVQYETAV